MIQMLFTKLCTNLKKNNSLNINFDISLEIIKYILI